jgi:hypothetical protein
MMIRVRKISWKRTLFISAWASTWFIAIRGWHDYLVEEGHVAGFFNSVAGAIGLFFGRGWLVTGDSLPATFVAAQFAAPGIVALSAFHLFRTRVNRSIRNARAQFRQDHVVLIGLGKSGQLIASQLAQAGEKCVVVIDTAKSNPDPESYLNRPRWAVLHGDGTNIQLLRAAGAANARMIHVATGNDGVDLAVIDSLRQILPERVRLKKRPPLAVRVQIDSSALSRRLQRQYLTSDPEELLAVEYVDLSSLRAAAVMEFVISSAVQVHEGLNDLPLVDELIFVGETSLIDELVSLASRSHRSRHMLGLPSLSVEAPRKAGESDVSTRAEPQGGEKTNSRLSSLVVVHTESPNATVESAARLAAAHLERAVVGLTRTGSFPVIAPKDGGDGRLILVDPDNLLQVPDLLIHGTFDLMARLIHLDYLHSLPEDQQDRPAARVWQDLDSMYRESSRAQAIDFKEKLRVVGCTLTNGPGEPAVFTEEETELLARLEHERWMTERLRHDPKYEHPDMRPFDELDEEAKDKDRRVALRISALAALLGLTVVRSSGSTHSKTGSASSIIETEKSK